MQGYGLTETSPFAAYNHQTRHRPGSIGMPIDGVEMKIIDPVSGEDGVPGNNGEIVVRGHNVMLGYWNRPAETAEAMRGGWFHTGDVGRVDSEGYFFIEDRLSDMVSSGGVKIYPAEIENVLYRHPAVMEAAVFGVPEPLLGEQLWANIVLQPGSATTETELREFCRERLAEVKVPAVVQFVAEIPRGPTGKMLKRVMRENAATKEREAAPTVRPATQEQIQQWIMAWLQLNCKLPLAPKAHPRIPFVDLGLDSIGAVRLANELSLWLAHDVEVTAAWNFPSPEVLAGRLAIRPASLRANPDPQDLDLPDLAVEGLLLAELEELNR